MRSASIAERLIGCLTSKDRASSMVGDLVELRPEKGMLWFWISIIRILVLLAWRPAVAYCAAVFIGGRVMNVFEMQLFGIHTEHNASEGLWGPFFSVLGGADTVLCIALLYGVTRYGARDRMTQLGLVWASLMTVVIYEWWRPVVLMVCLALSLFTAAVCLYNARSRRIFLALLTTIASGISGGLVAMYLDTRFERFVYPGPLGDVELRAHPSLQWMALTMYLLFVLISTFAFSRMHGWSAKKEMTEFQS